MANTGYNNVADEVKKDAVSSMLEYGKLQPSTFINRFARKDLTSWLNWLANCHEVMRGNQKIANRYNLTISEAAAHYSAIRNLFIAGNWKLEYIPAKRAFSATDLSKC